MERALLIVGPPMKDKSHRCLLPPRYSQTNYLIRARNHAPRESDEQFDVVVPRRRHIANGERRDLHSREYRPLVAYLPKRRRERISRRRSARQRPSPASLAPRSRCGSRAGETGLHVIVLKRPISSRISEYVRALCILEGVRNLDIPVSHGEQPRRGRCDRHNSASTRE